MEKDQEITIVTMLPYYEVNTQFLLQEVKNLIVNYL